MSGAAHWLVLSTAAPAAASVVLSVWKTWLANRHDVSVKIEIGNWHVEISSTKHVDPKQLETIMRALQGEGVAAKRDNLMDASSASRTEASTVNNRAAVDEREATNE